MRMWSRRLLAIAGVNSDVKKEREEALCRGTKIFKIHFGVRDRTYSCVRGVITESVYCVYYTYVLSASVFVLLLFSQGRGQVHKK